jgi:hypothetical protein
MGSYMASPISVDDIADRTSTTCRIYGVNTGKDTLHELHVWKKEDLLLPYLPGAFF